ncbi:MAG: GNAT family N-acetyltransferase [Anaerolineae bacterium]|nr:GNAT family N-acetyltransferase [Anaerolineae bacterium]
MYVPPAFREDDVDILVAFMRAHSFISLVSVLDGAPVASHIPIVVDAAEGQVSLSGHLAKANPQWRAFDGRASLAIFSGPHAYISPSLYEKRESVPTWNYIAAHATGVPRIVTRADDPAAIEAMLAAMIQQYEAAYQIQWDSLPATFRDSMLKGIVAFTMPVTRLEGKYKLSQNRSPADQRNVATALLASDDPTVAGVGAAMRRIDEGRSPHPLSVAPSSRRLVSGLSRGGCRSPGKGIALDSTVIETDRLVLIPMTTAFFEACLAGDLDTASQVIGLRVPEDWLLEGAVMRVFLERLRRDPAAQPWLMRGIGLRATGEMIGTLGFHLPPDAEYLRGVAPGGVEMGYTVFPAWRRQGYAREACAGLMGWATREQGITRFVVSISPENEPSLRLAAHFGFRKVGYHIDDEDGLEDIFVREAEA